MDVGLAEFEASALNRSWRAALKRETARPSAPCDGLAFGAPLIGTLSIRFKCQMVEAVSDLSAI